MLKEDDQFLRIKELFHFTDRRNLPQIRECGGIWSTELLRLGQVEFFAGGDAASLDLDVQGGWDTYVRLCFTQNHPMAHHVVQREGSPGVIYLEVDRKVLYEDGVKFATGIAYAQGVETVSLAEAFEREMIDFQALYDRTDWRIPEVWQKRHAVEKYEILVPTAVEMRFITNMPNG